MKDENWTPRLGQPASLQIIMLSRAAPAAREKRVTADVPRGGEWGHVGCPGSADSKPGSERIQLIQAGCSTQQVVLPRAQSKMCEALQAKSIRERRVFLYDALF